MQTKIKPKSKIMEEKNMSCQKYFLIIHWQKRQFPEDTVFSDVAVRRNPITQTEQYSLDDSSVVSIKYTKNSDEAVLYFIQIVDFFSSKGTCCLPAWE